ncbi:cytosolic carboxypeptidase-like protein 5 [Leguminivora glycinivorella]|uniref:cytosolic carboxypeptidase-like protein 5 n=1 Tax=Leguminivora glycinivorella TaxID=1035111 RepID=UPI00200D6D95|nr:cytosolic carboxypeptidase-like protein 5 [Leguminivora glycinivorella]
MDHNNIIECGGFYFIHNFDSGNLGHVERVPTELIAPSLNLKTNTAETPDYEFNMWTRPDCAGTEFENGNRTWFYFGIQAREPLVTVRLNLINLNKQGKMYNQGMAPVTRTLPGKPQWERIKDRPVHSMDDNTFTLSFKYRTSDNLKATTFFAFTYPFSFAELQIALNSIDLKMLPAPAPQAPDDIYYCRECVVYSLEGRRVDLLTITSHHGITAEREDRLKHLFPENKPRAFKFQNKKVIFISARVHPGETPSSFVFNGFLNLLLSRHDPIAIQLRKLYVFKMIPFLNPDGVARGHYRTDTRGVNLNRVYLNPSLIYHPTVYASRALIRYYHFGCEKEDTFDDAKSIASRSIQNISEVSVEMLESKKKKGPPYKSKPLSNKSSSTLKARPSTGDTKQRQGSNEGSLMIDQLMDSKKGPPMKGKPSLPSNKSSNTLKRPSTTEGSKQNSKAPSSGEENLSDQVVELKLREMTSQTMETHSPRPSNNPSLLNDETLRSCLGSAVHLSSSDELNIQGHNPLLPLRDTLKNSISLLMGTASVSESVRKESSNVRMGWCNDCRRAVNRLQETIPGLAGTVAGYNTAVVTTSFSLQSREGSPCRSIQEYAEVQKQQYDEQKALERKLQDLEQAATDETIYFCTNCFKRYIVTQNNEEIVRFYHCEVSLRLLPPPPAPKESQEKKPPAPAARSLRKKPAPPPRPREPDSGLFLYIDLHGHASKKGIFMYGNHFEDSEASVECMLLPRIMSLNNMHFHFSSCNFTERNMYLKDRRDGMSREGSGRVAVLKATGLVRSYTLECNYNTGRLVNILPPAVKDAPGPPVVQPVPPKYTPHIFEDIRARNKNLENAEDIDPWQVGRSLGASILDLTGHHPNSRVPCSEHRTLASVRDWLRAHTRTVRPTLTMSRLRPKTSSPTRAPLYARSKAKVTDLDRKENTYLGAKADERRTPPARSVHDLAAAAARSERARYLDAAAEPKPKTLGKRRNVLAVRKPNASKTLLAKQKPARRSADDDSPRPSLLSAKVGSKRSLHRAARAASRTDANRCRAMASSSSEEVAAWEDVPGGTLADSLSAAGKRRVQAFAAPQLKKIRLKTAL